MFRVLHFSHKIVTLRIDACIVAKVFIAKADLGKKMFDIAYQPGNGQPT